MNKPQFGEKKMNWQSVPMEKLIEHGWDFEETEIYTLRDTAACQNAWAYGDIAGGGLSPYCQHNDEPAFVFLTTQSFDKTIEMMTDFGWKLLEQTDENELEFAKDHDFAVFEGNDGTTGYLTTFVEEDYLKACDERPIEEFFDNVVWVVEDEVYDETGEFEHRIDTFISKSKDNAIKHLTVLRAITIRKFEDRFAGRDSKQGSSLVENTMTRFHISSEDGKTYYLAEVKMKNVL